MKNNCDVIIIGGGVMGTSIAYQLSKKGRKVVLVEKGYYCSGASGSCDISIFLQSKNPGIHLTLALDSAAMYPYLEDELEHHIEYGHKGGMILIETPEELAAMENFVRRQTRIGLKVEILDRKQASEMQDGLAEHLIGATYSPQDAEINPIELTRGFALVAQKRGVRILLETEVTGILKTGDKVTGVKTNRGDISAPLVVNAAGPWANCITEMIGISVPIKPRRGQIVVTEPAPPFIKKGMLSASYLFVKYNPDTLKNSLSRALQLGVGLSLSQTEKGNILIGGTREFVGYDTGNTLDGIEEILKNAARLVPGLKKVNIIRAMAGLRPYTPDGLPLIGYLPGVEGFFIAAGHEGDGVALAPITGRIVADLICEGETYLDISPLSPDRFTKKIDNISL
jgi:sarcosine oxidase subunit beta